MNEIDDLTDHEKSMLLAKVMELETFVDDFGKTWINFPGTTKVATDLYLEIHIALAWRVLNWASEQGHDIDDYSYPYYFAQGVEELFDTDVEIEHQIWAKPPADAQRLWLDKILELTIEAGLVKLEEETPR